MTPQQVLQRLTRQVPQLAGCALDIERAYDIMKGCFAGGGKLLVCGNGGSAADSEHIVGELMKGFLLKRPVPQAFANRLQDPSLADGLQGALPAISLTGQPSLSTAVANDNDPCLCFAQQVYGYGVAGDVLLGLSTSGNAVNVARAMEVARAKNMYTIGMTGEAGGRLLELADCCIRVPHRETYRVQEYHLPVYHTLCAMLEVAFFDE